MSSNDEIKKDLAILRMIEAMKIKFDGFKDIKQFEIAISKSDDRNELNIDLSFQYWYSDKIKQSFKIEAANPALENLLSERISIVINEEIERFSESAKYDQDAWKNEF